MADITKANYHDKFAKEVFSHHKNAIDFISNYLPTEVLQLIDKDSLQIIKDSFVDTELKEYFTDLLYEVSLKNDKDANIYILFEHKSYSESLVSFQLLRYMIKIWELRIKQDKSPIFIPIIPIILYHGRNKWTAKKNFQNLFDNKNKDLDVLKKYIPDFVYEICDLTNLTDEEIKGEVIIRTAMLLMKHIFDKGILEVLPNVLELLKGLNDNNTAMGYLEALLRYVTSASDNVTEDYINDIVPKIFNQGGEIMGTVAEKWIQQGILKGEQSGILKGRQEGEQIGISKGRQEGRREGLLDAIELGLNVKFGINGLKLLPKIQRIMDNEHLIMLKEAVKTVNNLNDIQELIPV